MPIELRNELDGKHYPSIKADLFNQAAIRAMHIYKEDPPLFWKKYKVETTSEFCLKDRTFKVRKQIKRLRDDETIWPGVVRCGEIGIAVGEGVFREGSGDGEGSDHDETEPSNGGIAEKSSTVSKQFMRTPSGPGAPKHKSWRTNMALGKPVGGAAVLGVAKGEGRKNTDTAESVWDVYPDFTKSDAEYQLICVLLFAKSHLQSISDDLRKNKNDAAAASAKGKEGDAAAAADAKKAQTAAEDGTETVRRLFAMVEREFKFSMVGRTKGNFRTDYWDYIVKSAQQKWVPT